MASTRIFSLRTFELHSHRNHSFIRTPSISHHPARSASRNKRSFLAAGRRPLGTWSTTAARRARPWDHPRRRRCLSPPWPGVRRGKQKLVVGTLLPRELAARVLDWYEPQSRVVGMCTNVSISSRSPGSPLSPLVSAGSRCSLAEVAPVSFVLQRSDRFATGPDIGQVGRWSVCVDWRVLLRPLLVVACLACRSKSLRRSLPTRLSA